VWVGMACHGALQRDFVSVSSQEGAMKDRDGSGGLNAVQGIPEKSASWVLPMCE
jgi:hypothetical protein